MVSRRPDALVDVAPPSRRSVALVDDAPPSRWLPALVDEAVPVDLAAGAFLSAVASCFSVPAAESDGIAELLALVSVVAAVSAAGGAVGVVSFIIDDVSVVMVESAAGSSASFLQAPSPTAATAPRTIRCFRVMVVLSLLGG